MNNNRKLISAILTIGVMLSPAAIADDGTPGEDDCSSDELDVKIDHSCGEDSGGNSTNDSQQICRFDSLNYVSEDFSSITSPYIYWEFVWQGRVIESGYHIMPSQLYYNGKYYSMGAFEGGDSITTRLTKYQICQV